MLYMTKTFLFWVKIPEETKNVTTRKITPKVLLCRLVMNLFFILHTLRCCLFQFLYIMMLSGLIEFGFMLNYYLDIIDAAREAARFAASDDPLHDDATGAYIDPNLAFYNRAQTVTLQSLTIGSGGQITLNPASDDVVVSVFSVTTGVVDKRFPLGPGEVALYNNKNSELDIATDINPALDAAAPNTGMVSVEIFYDYHMVLGLPWIRLGTYT